MSFANFPDHTVVIASRIDGNNAWDFKARKNGDRFERSNKTQLRRFSIEKRMRSDVRGRSSFSLIRPHEFATVL